jgi:hypothetical protein
MALRARVRGVCLALPVLVSLASLASLTVAAPSWAQGAGGQGEKAVELFTEAKQLMEKQQYDLACPKFLQSYELDPTKAGVLYALAECYVEAGKVASASARYAEYVRAAAALPPDVRAKHDERVQRAKAQQATLAPQVPELTLVLAASMPSGTRVTLDGQELSAAALGAPRPVDPGDHQVITRTPDGIEKQHPLKIAKGEKKRMELDAASSGSAATDISTGTPPTGPGQGDQPAPSGEGMSTMRIGALAGFGLGAVGLVVGGITGGIVLGSKSAIQEACPTTLDNGTTPCRSQADVDKAQGAQTLGTVSSIAFIVGAVGAGAGLTLFLLEPKKTSNAATQGWIAVGPTSLGPGGVMMGASGAW